MSDLPRLLADVQKKDLQAAAELLPLACDELRRLAAVRMVAEAPGHTLDATALVHEAYLRLVGDQHFDGRGHFFAAAAEAMRRILVDHARAKRAEKRGNRPARADLDPDHLLGTGFDPDRWIDLDEALTRFAAIDPTAAELAKGKIRRSAIDQRFSVAYYQPEPLENHQYAGLVPRARSEKVIISALGGRPNDGSGAARFIR